MKHTKKAPLWYNSEEKNSRYTPMRETDLAQMAADKEGRALLDFYYRMYRKKNCKLNL